MKKKTGLIAIIFAVIAILAIIIIVKHGGNKVSKDTETLPIKTDMEENSLVESTETIEGISEVQTDYEKSEKRLAIHNSDVTYEISEDTVYVGGLTLKLPSDYEYSECQTDNGEKKIVISHPHEDSDFLLHEIEILVYEVDEFPDTTEQFIYDLLHSLHLDEDEFYCYRNDDNMKETGIFLESYDRTICLVEKEDHTYEIISFRYPVFLNDNDEKYFSDFLEDGDIIQTYQNDILNSQGDTCEYYRLASNDDENGILLSTNHKNELHVYSAENGLLTCKNDIEVNQFYFDLFTDVNGDGFKDIIFDADSYYNQYCIEGLVHDKMPDTFFGYVWNLDEKKYEKIEGTELIQEYGDFIERYYSHKVEKVADPIPEDLKEFVSQLAMLTADEREEALKPYCIDTTIDSKELSFIVSGSYEMKQNLVAVEGCGFSEWCLVDADNDGIEDLYAELYSGGSGGFVEDILYHGNGDGTYSRDYVYDSIMHDRTFISWNGKNYLVEPCLDYNRKDFMGLYLSSFENGKLSQKYLYEHVRKEDEKAVTINNTFLLDKSYSVLKDSLDQFVYTDYLSEDNCPYANCGTAETETEDSFSSDLNNDGVMDTYTKSFFYPSNMGTRLTLETTIQDNEELSSILDEIIYSNEFYPVSMWADETEFGVVTYILYEESLFDYHIYGYLIEDDHYQMLVLNDYHYERDVVEKEF